MKKLIMDVLIVLLLTLVGIYFIGVRKLDNKGPVQIMSREQEEKQIAECKKWQSQEEFHKRFMEPQRFISDYSPCDGL